MLNKKNAIPLYRQLKEIIQDKVESGSWSPGQLIPSESELIKIYGVSRTTVRQALGELVQGGLLKRDQGRGTFVAEPKFEHPLSSATGFTHDFVSRGYKPGSITLFSEEVVPSMKVASKLELRGQSTVIRLERLRTVEGQAVGIHTAYLVGELLPGLELSELKREDISLYQILWETLGLDPGEAIETLEAGSADEYQSRLLGIEKGSPVLRLERVTYLNDGSPIEYVDMVYRADRYKYVTRLRVAT